MTSEKAIRMINEYILEDCIDDEWVECLGICKVALNKQIPKKPVEYTEDDMEFIHYKCPNCLNIQFQHYKKARENMKPKVKLYCQGCGQLIDWEACRQLSIKPKWCEFILRSDNT